jgi:membrane associated rhomboid family serine protease
MNVLSFQETAGGSPRLPPQRGPELNRPHEPMFNAPWPAVALAGVIVGGYAVQSQFSQVAVVTALGFSPFGLVHGRWYTALTALFLHGNWPHALMNAAFGLAFATPVARFFGDRALALAGFFAFYLACGVLSNLGYAAVNLGDINALVGASGAVSGLMGATSRLMAGHGRLGPIWSRPVLAMGGAWVAINLLIAVLGSGFTPGAGGAPVAWEAHLAGFAVGVLLIGPVARMCSRA